MNRASSTILCLCFCFCLVDLCHAAPPPTAAATDPHLAGYTEPFKLIKVSSAESGVLSELLVKEGDQVKKGQVIGRLDARVLESDRAIAREELSRITLRLNKLTELEKSKDAAPEEVERVRSEAAIQQLRVQRIDTQLETFTLLSPIDGVISEVKIEVAESVVAATTHLLTIVQVDKLSVNLLLPSAVARSFKIGQSVPLLIFDTQQEVSGEVVFISPITEPATGTRRVKLVMDNALGNLQSGARCGLRPDAKTPATNR